MISLLLGAAWADCQLAVVVPGSMVTGVMIGSSWLTTGSVVRIHEACLVGWRVTVLSENWHYRNPEMRRLAPGADVCVPAGALLHLEAYSLLAMVPPPDGSEGLTPGTLLPALTCRDDGYFAEGIGKITPDMLTWVRPVSATQLDDIRTIQQTYEALFGPLSLGAIPFTDWGYVGLPLPDRLTDAEIAAEAAAEGLLTERQREKVTTDLGPMRDGAPVYTHFTGADARFTDLWAEPETIISLLKLAASWAALCEADNPRSCTLQIGDLAWYGDVLPDPLGHRDHHRGMCVDIRLFRDDGSRYEAYHNRSDDRDGVSGGYSASLTTAFLRLAASEANTLYFNDPAIIADVPAVQARRGHDDHIHLCF